MLLQKRKRKGGMCAIIERNTLLTVVMHEKLRVDVDNLLISSRIMVNRLLKLPTGLSSGALDVVVIDFCGCVGTERSELEGEMGTVKWDYMPV